MKSKGNNAHLNGQNIKQLDIDRSDMESIYKNCTNTGATAC